MLTIKEEVSRLLPPPRSPLRRGPLSAPSRGISQWLHMMYLVVHHLNITWQLH